MLSVVSFLRQSSVEYPPRSCSCCNVIRLRKLACSNRKKRSEMIDALSETELAVLKRFELDYADIEQQAPMIRERTRQTVGVANKQEDGNRSDKNSWFSGGHPKYKNFLIMDGARHKVQYIWQRSAVLRMRLCSGASGLVLNRSLASPEPFIFSPFV